MTLWTHVTYKIFPTNVKQNILHFEMLNGILFSKIWGYIIVIVVATATASTETDLKNPNIHRYAQSKYSM